MTNGSPGSRVPLIVAAVVIAVALAAAARWYLHSRFIESTDNAYVEGEMASLSPRVMGYAAEVLVKENQAVKKDEVLLRLDDTSYRAQLQQAEAQQAARQSALATLDAQIALQADVIRQAEAERDGARAEQVRADADYRRSTDLFRDRVITRAQYDTVTANAAKAQAALAAAEARVSGSKASLAVYHSQHDEAQAALQQAMAAVAAARENLGNTQLAAPFDGVIGNKHVQTGEVLQPGLPVLTVVNLSAVHITANFKETQLEKMTVGQKALLKVDAFPGQEIEGQVESLSPASGSRFSLLPPENATGNFTKIVQRIPVRIALPADSPWRGKLRPGMSVEVDVDTRTGSPAAAP